MSSIDDEPSYRGLARQHAFHQVMEVKEQLLRQAQLKGKSEQDAERIYREKIRAEWERHYVEKLTELLRAKSLNSRKGLL
jgi:hypothetical protein